MSVVVVTQCIISIVVDAAKVCTLVLFICYSDSYAEGDTLGFLIHLPPFPRKS